MNKIVIVLGICLMIGSFVQAQTKAEQDSCALFGGVCQNNCQHGFNMNTKDTMLCGNGRNNICCNTAEDRCKSQGGECAQECEGNVPRYDAPDCKALGRQCCIYI